MGIPRLIARGLSKGGIWVTGITVIRSMRSVYGSVTRVKIYGRTVMGRDIKQTLRPDSVVTLCHSVFLNIILLLRPARRLSVTLCKWWGCGVSDGEKQSWVSGSQHRGRGSTLCFPTLTSGNAGVLLTVSWVLLWLVFQALSLQRLVDISYLCWPAIHPLLPRS